MTQGLLRSSYNWNDYAELWGSEKGDRLVSKKKPDKKKKEEEEEETQEEEW